jgi:Zn-dependent protease
MLFNLIPLAPLDGEKILENFAPPGWWRTLDNIRPYGPMILLVIAIVLPMVGIDLIGWIIGPPLRALLTLLVG